MKTGHGAERLCPSCAGRINTGTICDTCLGSLHDDLATIGDAITELHTQLARQSRTGNDGGTARSAIRPLPYDHAASEALDLLRSVLIGWTRDVCEHHGNWPHNTMRGMARRLRWHDWRTHPAADEFADELHYTLSQVTDCIDTPPQRRYLGPCGAVDLEGRVCSGDVIQRWSRTPRCRDCDATHAYDERMAWIMDLAEDQLVTASIAAGALSAWGQHITPDLVRLWAHRGRLIAHGHDRAGRPVYSFGECRELALASIKPKRKMDA